MTSADVLPCTGLFEADEDIDIALDLNQAFGSGDKKLKLSNMVHQTDMLAPQKARDYYQTAEYAASLADLVTTVRQQLDTDGLGNKLFDKYRDENHIYFGRYRIILVGALMMRAGAKIREEDIQHLREVVPQINCNEGYRLPLGDQGFRGPGKRQFLAALDHYQPGVPRSFAVPSCFACGKIQEDIGKALQKCARCQGAHYCDKV